MIGKTNAGSGTQVFYLGTGTSFDVSNVPGYQNLTKDNFMVIPTKMSISGSFWNNGSSYGTYCSGKSASMSDIMNYNASTGILTIKNTISSQIYSGQSYDAYRTDITTTMEYKAYLVKGKIKIS